jgi:hypothetical protein
MVVSDQDRTKERASHIRTVDIVKESNQESQVSDESIFQKLPGKIYKLGPVFLGRLSPLMHYVDKERLARPE